MSRRGSAQGYTGEAGNSLKKVPSRGGLWHDEVSQDSLLPFYLRRRVEGVCPS